MTWTATRKGHAALDPSPTTPSATRSPSRWGRGAARGPLLPAALGLALAAAALSPAAQAAQQGTRTMEIPRTQLNLGSPHQWRYSSVTVLRLNPLGLINQSQVGYRFRLFDPEDNSPDAPLSQRLFQNTFIGLSFAPSVSPAFVRPGALLEIQPLAILKLSALYERQTHFGTFRTLQSYEAANAVHSDSAMEATEAAAYATSGQSLTFGGLLQLKFGRIAARTNFRAQWVDMDLQGDDTVFYDIMFDILQPGRGWMFTTDTDAFYSLTADDNTLLGIRHTWVTVRYPDDALPTDEAFDLDKVPTHRVGPILVHRLNNVTGTAFNQPTVFVVAQWWLNHRYRTGEDVTQAMPYFLAGFGFSGDLFTAGN